MALDAPVGNGSVTPAAGEIVLDGAQFCLFRGTETGSGNVILGLATKSGRASFDKFKADPTYKGADRVKLGTESRWVGQANTLVVLEGDMAFSIVLASPGDTPGKKKRSLELAAAALDRLDKK